VNGDGFEDLVLASTARVWIYFNPLGLVDDARPFRRGDANADGVFDLTDAINIGSPQSLRGVVEEKR
jgi:hypothetical protein